MGLIDILLARAKQGYRTIGYPKEPPVLPDLFQGRPVVRQELCRAGCGKCADVCPTGALTVPAHIKNPELLLFATSDDTGGDDDKLNLDVGRCIFCGQCEKACGDKAIEFTKEYRMATSSREALTSAREHVMEAEHDRGADDGDEQAPHVEARHARPADEVEDEATDDRAHDAEHDVEDQALAPPVDDLARDESREQPEEDPADD